MPGEQIQAPKGHYCDVERCSRVVWSGRDTSYCVWHSQTDNKSLDDFGDRLHSRINVEAAYLRDATLSNADFKQANLVEANLINSDLSDANFNNANLSEAVLIGADLTNADLSGATLTNAKLIGVDLTEAQLQESNMDGIKLDGAILSDATLTNATITNASISDINYADSDLVENDIPHDTLTDELDNSKIINISGQEADFSGSNLSNADLTDSNLSNADFINAELDRSILKDTILEQTNFSGANLQNSKITGADIKTADFSRSTLAGATITADMDQSSLEPLQFFRAKVPDNIPVSQIVSEVDLSDKDLSHAHCEGIKLDGRDLSGTDLSNANLASSSLEECNLNNTVLHNADIRDANLQDSEMKNADMNSADLSGANLQQSNMQGSDLARANFNGADLTETDLKNCSVRLTKFTDCNIKGVNLEGVNFSTDTSSNLIEAALTSDHDHVRWIGTDAAAVLTKESPAVGNKMINLLVGIMMDDSEPVSTRSTAIRAVTSIFINNDNEDMSPGVYNRVIATDDPNFNLDKLESENIKHKLDKINGKSVESKLSIEKEVKNNFDNLDKDDSRVVANEITKSLDDIFAELIESDIKTIQEEAISNVAPLAMKYPEEMAKVCVSFEKFLFDIEKFLSYNCREIQLIVLKTLAVITNTSESVTTSIDLISKFKEIRKKSDISDKTVEKAIKIAKNK